MRSCILYMFTSDGHVTDIGDLHFFIRIMFSEIGFAVFLFFCACCDLAFGENYYYVYIYLQSLAFLVVGFGYVGTIIPNSQQCQHN